MVNPETTPSGHRRQWLYAALAAAGGLAAGGYMAWARYEAKAIDAGAEHAFWQQVYEDVRGDTQQMAVFRGRPLLVNFWATWCPPCVDELPLLDSFYAEHKAKGPQVLGLALDKAAAVKAFLERQPLRFPVVLGGSGGLALSKSLGNMSGSLPFSVLFGTDGTIRARKIGKLNREDLQHWQQLQ